uniref:Uncharacterized protein n=1 Tax=Daphnia magna TaxID=35525 RepID=A0A0P6G337_9CRUS
MFVTPRFNDHQLKCPWIRAIIKRTSCVSFDSFSLCFSSDRYKCSVVICKEKKAIQDAIVFVFFVDNSRVFIGKRSKIEI